MPRKNSRSDQGKDVPAGEPLAHTIGDRIKAAADAVGSRKEAARIAGVSDDMLYRYMREETPPRFEAIVALAHAAGVSLDWMATGRDAPRAARESAGRYDVELEGWARNRIEEIRALLNAESELPLPARRIEADEELRGALADLRRIARLDAVPNELRTSAARTGNSAFSDPELAQLEKLAEGDGSGYSAQRLADVADELEDAIREVGYRPPDLILDGFKTAMYVNGMPRSAAVTLLQFLDAHERKRQQ